MLTAWYQVFIATLLNIAGVINILIYGQCRDKEYHENYNTCEDIEVVFLIIILIIFTGQILFMVHLAMTANNYLKEYMELHKDAIDSTNRQLFN